MKRYKLRFASTEKLIEQIKENSAKIRKTQEYIDFTVDSVFDLFKKIKKLNIKLSKFEVEEKSLKHESYEIKDVNEEDKEEKSKLNKIIDVGLSDFIVKVNLLLRDVKTIYIDCLVILYRKYKETDDKLVKEEIKNIARDIFEIATEETVIIKDIFEKKKFELGKRIKKEIARIEKSESDAKIWTELESVQDILFDISVLIPKIEEIIPQIESEAYLLENHAEENVNKDIVSVKKMINSLKKFVDEQAKSLFEEIKV